MNGLKFIRTRCNYSQTALASELGVCKFTIRQWETSKKTIPNYRKKELRDFFGLENEEWFGEIDTATCEEILSIPLYKTTDETSEHFRFAIQNEIRLRIDDNVEELISLDDKCAQKRRDLKNLSNEIRDYCDSVGVINSYDRLFNMSRVSKIIGGAFNALKAIDNKKSSEKMDHFFILSALINAAAAAVNDVPIDDFEREYAGEPKKITEILEVFTNDIAKEITDTISTIQGIKQARDFDE